MLRLTDIRAATAAVHRDAYRGKALDRFVAKIPDGLMQRVRVMIGDQYNALAQVVATAQQVPKKVCLTFIEAGAVGSDLIEDQQIHLLQGFTIAIALCWVFDEPEEQAVNDRLPLLKDHRTLMVFNQFMGDRTGQG